MLDFKVYDHETSTLKDRDKLLQIAEEHKSKIRVHILGRCENKIELGEHLISLFRSRCYCYLSEHVAWNCHNRYFFQFCKQEFDLDKSQVTRLMNVVDEFASCGKLRARYRNFSWSVLAEMLPLSHAEREPITSEWTRQDVRDYKKTLVAPAQRRKKKKTVESTEPEAYHAMSREDLVELCEQLQRERYRMYGICIRNGIEFVSMEDGGLDGYDPDKDDALNNGGIEG